MCQTKLTVPGVAGYFDKVLGVDDLQPGDKVSARVINTHNRLTELFETGKGNNLSGIRRSVWAAYNAVTEYVDHEKTVKGENRLKSIWFGGGRRMKERAYEEAMVLLSK